MSNLEDSTRKLLDIESIRHACISSGTKNQYKSKLNVIKKWILTELIKEVSTVDHFFGEDGEIDVNNFTPVFFQKFLAHYRLKVTTNTLSAYRSAIKHLYRAKKLPLPAEYGEDMTVIFSGLRRVEAEEKQTSYNPSQSGKQPLSFSMYKKICEATMKVFDGGFSHLYLITQWNLMCRSVSVQTIHTNHLVQRDDSIGILFHKSKTDQEGTAPKDPRHIYANPLNPFVCWFTALAMYFACNPRLDPGTIFPGSNQKMRFCKTLNKFMKDESFKKLYGTHSIRKGVGTYAASGSTTGPSMVSICLRCGWSIGGVQDRYLRYADAGDQYLGRVVAGLPVDSPLFSILPPHFKQEANNLIGSHIRALFPHLATEESLVPILRLCLASLVQHADFLQSNLPGGHPLLSTHIFAKPSVIEVLRAHLVTTESEWMVASGIPPHVLILDKLEELPGELECRIRILMEKNGVAAGNITRDVLKATLSELVSDLGLQTRLTEQPQQQRQYHYWNNKFHVLPQGFTLPHVDPLSAWLVWWFGDRDYPPYRSFGRYDMSASVKARYSEWSSLMNHIIQSIERVTSTQLPDLKDEIRAIELFNIGYNNLDFERSKRETQLSMSTILRKIREAAQRKAGTLNGVYAFQKRKRKTGSASKSSSKQRL